MRDGLTVAARDARPLTPSARRKIVASALGAMVYRLPSDRVAMIAADCADLDARATAARAAAWGSACRRALDAGRPLPAALEGAGDPVADALAVAVPSGDAAAALLTAAPTGDALAAMLEAAAPTGAAAAALRAADAAAPAGLEGDDVADALEGATRRRRAKGAA